MGNAIKALDTTVATCLDDQPSSPSSPLPPLPGSGKLSVQELRHLPRQDRGEAPESTGCQHDCAFTCPWPRGGGQLGETHSAPLTLPLEAEASCGFTALSVLWSLPPGGDALGESGASGALKATPPTNPESGIREFQVSPGLPRRKCG